MSSSTSFAALLLHGRLHSPSPPTKAQPFHAAPNNPSRFPASASIRASYPPRRPLRAAGGEQDNRVQELRVPDSWLTPAGAAQSTLIHFYVTWDTWIHNVDGIAIPELTELIEFCSAHGSEAAYVMHYCDASDTASGEESEWLRETLHQWLDDEYCPEPANFDISSTAARSYQESLMAGQSDLGEILLKMVGDLDQLSYRESFHGPFSAANAAVRLITQRMESLPDDAL
ncbi:hypothetical protein U9M48_036788 [Paspalum notatum var. saurae]|uniref:Uncharacterized protein n=1 Tax=Paspalum notatum var. saurae TaxID=547442 RepID=A0AAQ3X9W0_PASNO